MPIVYPVLENFHLYFVNLLCCDTFASMSSLNNLIYPSV